MKAENISHISNNDFDFLNQKPLPISDVIFVVDERNQSQIEQSIIENSYFTASTFDDRMFRFKNFFNAAENVSLDTDSEGNEIYYSIDEQRKIITKLFNLYSTTFSKLQECKAYINNEIDINFSVNFDFGDGKSSLRCNYKKCLHGYTLTVRSKPPKTPYMEELDIHVAIRDILLSEPLKSGLVLIVAEHGEGKTTTATSAMVSRLRKYGGHCNSYEDPIEYVSQGFHGENGYCIQTEVEGDYNSYIKASMRQYPIIKNSIMYIGEIRNASTAKLAINASAQGILVIATFHAEDILSAFKRITQMISEDGNEADAADLLSTSFRMIFSQYKTLNKKGQGWKKYRISGKAFYATSDEVKGIINSSISNRKFDSLKSIIKTQNLLCEKYRAGDINIDTLLRGTNVN